MKESLIRLRDIYHAELERLETLESSLIQGITCMQSKEFLAKRIEDALRKKHTANRVSHPIDRTKESEIARVLSHKNKALNKAKSNYRSGQESLEYTKASNEEHISWLKRDIQYAYNSECRKKAEKELKEYKKNSEKTCSEKEKQYKKTYIDELKRIFGEVDEELKRFHKFGISRENLLDLVSIMKRACAAGEMVGTIPQSYQQKVYRWELVAKDIPVDEERKEKNDEALAKNRMDLRIKTIQKNIPKYVEEIESAKEALRKEKRELKNLTNEHYVTDREYKERKNNLLKDIEEKQKNARGEFEKKENKLRDTYIKEVHNIQTTLEIERKILKDIEESRTFLRREKEELQEKKKRVFFLSFGKKSALKDEIADVDKKIVMAEEKLQEHHDKIASLDPQIPEITLQKALKENERLLEETLSLKEQKCKTQVEELEKKVNALQGRIATTTNYINELEKTLEQNQLYLQQDEKELGELFEKQKDFHKNYLIDKYGRRYGANAEINKQILLQTIAGVAINAIKKELDGLDKKIREKEEAEARELEAKMRELVVQRNAQIKKAKEEERIRKEQEARRERIRKELQERDREQAFMEAMDKTCDSMADVIGELEANPNHPLLQKELCPLEDDGKRVITNSIVRKRYTQNAVRFQCDRYVLWFVNGSGEAISDRRLVERKEIGTKTEISFEIKNISGSNKGNFYLLFMDLETWDILCAQKYKINISFANDFDF